MWKVLYKALPPIIGTIIAVLLLGAWFFANTGVAEAAREDEVWHERVSTYLETIWPEGRDILINGFNHYLNFGTESGSGGYGFRDNGGVIECKDDGGAWAPCAGGGSGGIATSTALADQQVLYGTGVGTVGSEAAFTYNYTTNLLTVSGNASTTQISASEIVYIPDGLVGTPSLRFTGDPDTGIYRNTSNTIGLSGGGAGVSWNGATFFPNTDNARNLGSVNNRWLNYWGSGTATTSVLYISGLSNGCLQVATGLVTSTGVACGSGSGSGSVATSSSETATYVPYYTSTNGTPAAISGGESTFTYDATNNLLSVTNATTTALSVTGNTYLGITNGKVYAGDDLTQVLYIPNDQVNLLGSSFYGNGGVSVNNTTGNEGKFNTSVGIEALSALTTGNSNMALGYRALEDLTTGTFNVAMGANALANIIAGTTNVGVGNSALAGATTSAASVAIGSEAGSNLNPNSSVFIGHQSGKSTAGNFAQNNTFVGYQTGTVAITGANNNILIGYRAADALTSGANNIAIGYDIDLPTASGSNQLTIGNTIFGTAISSTGTTVDTDARIGVGSTTPWATLTVTNVSANPSFVVEDSSADASPFVIDLAGNVGIGSTTPGHALTAFAGSAASTACTFPVSLGASPGASSAALGVGVMNGLTGGLTAFQGYVRTTCGTNPFVFQPYGGFVGIGLQSTPAGGLVMGSQITTTSRFFATTVTTIGAPTATPSASGGSMADGTYYYVITAVSNGGATERGTESAAATVVGGGGSGSVALSWSAPSGGGVDYYNIYRTTTSGTYGATTFVTSVAGTSHTDILNTTTTGTPATSNSAYLTKISSSGNSWFNGALAKVGIGTTSPSSLLHGWASDTGTTITSASAAMLEVTNSNTTNNNFADLGFSTVNSSGARVVTGKVAMRFTNHTAGSEESNMLFLTMTGGAPREALTILGANGFVGISTTTPGSVLSIGSSTQYINLNNTSTSTFAFPVRSNCFTTDGNTCITGGAGGTPGGANTNVQFNDGGAFGGEAGFNYVKTLGQLSVPSNGWYGIGGALVGYASTTNESTIWGLGAGGNNATTSATVSNTTAVGFAAGSGITTGTSNTAVGSGALQRISTGINNTGVGRQAIGSAGSATGSGNRNVAVGAGALNSVTGSGNIALGFKSSSNSMTGSSNIQIGTNVQVASLTASQQLNIGGIIFGTGLYNNASTISSAAVTNGNLGIGTSTPYAQLSIQGVDGSTNTTLFAVASSTISATTTHMVVMNTGKVGVGTTSPWGIFSVGATAYDGVTPLFVVSTSTSIYGDLYRIHASSTESTPVAMPGSYSSFNSSGVRLILGAFDLVRGLALDQINVNGRINTGDWTLFECKGGSAIGTTISASANFACGDFNFRIFSTGSIATQATEDVPHNYARILSGASAGNGAALFAGDNSRLPFSGATSTPVFETVVRKTPSAGTLAAYYFGFNDSNSPNVSQGCAFVASTTQNNFQFVTKNGATASQTNTNISTTTTNFTRFRIEMDNTSCRGYVQTPTTAMTLIAQIPSGASYDPADKTAFFMYGERTSGAASFDVDSLRLWVRRTLWEN